MRSSHLGLACLLALVTVALFELGVAQPAAPLKLTSHKLGNSPSRELRVQLLDGTIDRIRFEVKPGLIGKLPADFMNDDRIQRPIAGVTTNLVLSKAVNAGKPGFQARFETCKKAAEGFGLYADQQPGLDIEYPGERTNTEYAASARSPVPTAHRFQSMQAVAGWLIQMSSQGH